MYQNDRKGRVSGGVLIATKANLRTREFDYIYSFELFECVIVEVDSNKHQTVSFVHCYRAPTDQDFVWKLKSLLNTLQINKYKLGRFYCW